MPEPDDAPERWREVLRILEGAFDLEPSDRDAYLARECADDPGLRHEVESLLRADADPPTFLGRNALTYGASALGDTPQDALPSGHEEIGGFRILEELGRGGMGRVYLAERARGDFTQRVAIKVVRGDVDSASVNRRFLRERQILANLQHPNIAGLMDGGAMADGKPYFVMEYVEGLPITTFCAQEGASLDRRLQLFEEVCEAVGYAHDRLVVHRDLKPSNILVDRDGTVRLLDFGIARLLEVQDELSASPTTQVHGAPLTPEYAAPEQLLGQPATAAADVYSLGVVLYELLTGQRPHARDGRSLVEFERVVSREVPTQPSRLADRAPDVGQGVVVGRGAQTRDLDAVVLHALKKEPAERYSSVARLLDDIRRVRSGFPVSVRDDSTTYRLRRFIGRNRIAVGVSSTALVGLVVALLVAVFQARVAIAERDAREAEANRARAVADFSVGLFDLVDPEEAQGRAVTVDDLLGAGVARVAALEDQPEEQAAMMEVMARVSYNATRFEAADSLYRQVIALRESLTGSNDPGLVGPLRGLGETLMMRNALDEARDAFERAKRLYEASGATDTEAMAHDIALAFAYFTVDQRAESEQLLRDVIDRAQTAGNAEGATQLAEARYTLARVLDYYGDHQEAESYLRQALLAAESRSGPDHSATADVAFTLARNLANQGEYDEARDLYARTGRIYERVHGADNVYVAMTIYALAQVEHRRGDLGNAEREYLRAAELYGRTSPGSPWEAYARVALGQVLIEQGRAPEAVDELQSGLDIYTSAQPPDVDQIAVARSWLGRALAEIGSVAAATRHLQAAVDTLGSRPHMARQYADAREHLERLRKSPSP